MVLHLCQKDEIAGSNVCAAPTVGHQVDTLGGIARKDNLFAVADIDEASHFDARSLHGCRGFFTDFVDSAMDISVICLVVGAHGVDDGTRFL